MYAYNARFPGRAAIRSLVTQSTPVHTTESLPKMTSTRRADYRNGTVYALVTATLLALQEPFSALAARSLSSSYFIGFTQIALLSSVPLLIARRDSRRDLFALLADIGNIAKLAILFMTGVAGLFV